MLIDRIRTLNDGVLGEKQSGFRSGRVCVYQISVVRQLCKKFNFGKVKRPVLGLYGPRKGI